MSVEPLESRIAPATLYAASFNRLLVFDSATPQTVEVISITGLQQGGEFVHGIDFRPATGELYACSTQDGVGNDLGRFALTLNPAPNPVGIDNILVGVTGDVRVREVEII